MSPCTSTSCGPMWPRIANPEKLVLLHDHVVPAPTVQAANNAKRMREFVDRFEVKNYFPVGKHGISHVVVAQEGFALPGKILANADSHTCSSGALNCLARGMGPSEMTLHPLQGPDLVHGRARRRRSCLEGQRSRAGLPARRDPLHPGQYGDFAGRNLEWHGDGLSASASTAASRWRPSRPSCRRSSRSSRTTTCWRSTWKGGPSGPSSPRIPTTMPSTSR